MAWKPAKSATPAQQQRAVELLRTAWQLGLIVEEGGVQYHGAYHPNYPGQQPDLAAPDGMHRGVEVWVQDSGVSDTQPAVQAGPWKPDPKNRASEAERELVLAEFEKRGWPRDEANAMVSIESGWDPSARNVQGFSGLIGFGPWFVKRWGLTKPIWQMSAAEQAPLVGRYLDEATGGKRWRYPGDTYMTGAAPAYIGASDSTVVYARGTKAWEQNPGWRPPGGGDITAGSIRATLLRRLSKGGGGALPPPKDPSTIPAPPSPSDSPLPESQSLASFLSRLQAATEASGGYLTSTHPRIVSVIKEYQRSHGLRDDGRIGKNTLKAMKDGT